MFVQLRPNLWLASEEAIMNPKDYEKLETAGINRIVVVANDISGEATYSKEVTTFMCPLRSDRMNPTHLKDLACHCPKYMLQNGDKVLIVSKTGMMRGAYIAARILCELEGKSIYDIFIEMQSLIEGFDVGKAYF